MAPNDDEDWIRALAGKEAPDADPSVIAEARAVRDAMARAREAESPGAHDEAELQRLLFRLRREGLLGTTIMSAKWRPYVALAVAASLMVVVGVVSILPGDKDRAPVPELTMRGLPSRPPFLIADDPDKLAAQIVSELEALGEKPTSSRDKQGTTRIESQWPQWPDEAHRKFLLKHGLPGPGDKRLVVDVEPRTIKP